MSTVSLSRLRLFRLALSATIASGLVLAIAFETVYAHAELNRSDPAVDSIVERAPPRITLYFTEQPEIQFSEIQVLDRNQRRVDRGDLRVDPTDSLAISIGLREEAPGTYTVLWKALSTVDGHVTRGAFVFTVGLDQIPTGLAVAGPGSSSTATPDRVAVRLLTYIGLATVLGFFTFLWFILLPVAAAGGLTGDARGRAINWSWRLACVGLVVALLASVGALITQSAAAFDVSPLQAIGQPSLAVAFGTRFGALWWAKLALLLGLGGALLALRYLGPLASLVRIGAGLGILLALVHVLGSHPAAAPGATRAAVILDWVHLVAVGVWVGGLAHLLVTVVVLLQRAGSTESVRVAASMVPRFSALGLICVSSLALTGFYQSWLLVGSPAALVGTEYGRALLLKLAFITPLLGLAAANLLILRPRLERALRWPASGSELPRRLQLTVAAEVGFTLAVLTVVGVLTNLEPGREALLAQGVIRPAGADDLRATLQVQPAVSGLNRFELRLTDRSGRPVADAERVALRFTMLTMDMGESELIARHQGDGTYLAQGGPLVMNGDWRIEAVVRRRGVDDVRPVFDVPVSAPSESGASRAAAPVAEGNLILGVEIAIVGLAILVFAYRRALLRRALSPALLGGMATLAVGVIFAVSAAATLRAGGQNPIAPTRQSGARGGEIYAERCAICHGDTGAGDGPAGIGLRPPPADFRVHLAAGHTDQQLYDWVTNGVPSTAMPAFRDQLTEEDRWHALNYIRLSFGPGRPQQPAVTGG